MVTSSINPHPTYSPMGKRLGRPLNACTRYTLELAEEICQRIASGESLAAICRSEHMPPTATVQTWVLDNREGFAAVFDRARELRAEKWAEELIDIADDSTNDYMDRVNAQGNVTRVLDTEHVARTRLRLDTRKWVISKVLPKKYGDKVELTSKNLNVTAPFKAITDPHEALRVYQQLMNCD